MNLFLKYFLIFSSLVSCSRFYSGDPLVTNNARKSNRMEICYELIGWEHDDFRKHASEILSSLQNSQTFKKISSSVKSPIENRIQIILVSNQSIKPLFGEQTEPVSWMIERKPGATFLTILNRMASYRSFLLIPYFANDDTQITFRHWNGNHLVRDYTYSLKNYMAIGWIPLLIKPFDEGEEVKTMYDRVTRKFIFDFQGENP